MNAIKLESKMRMGKGARTSASSCLPANPERDLLLTLTYAVVAFSILVQGTTLP